MRSGRANAWRSRKPGEAERHRGGLARPRVRDPLVQDDPQRPFRQLPPPAIGPFGGKPGSPSWNYVNPGRADCVPPVMMTEVEKLKRGDVFRHEMSGGGGHGDPLARNPEDVLRDIVEERVSPAPAEAECFVLVGNTENTGTWTLEFPSPGRLKGEMRTSAHSAAAD